MRPQLTVVVDLDSLLGHQLNLGGELGWAGPLAPEPCRRLACDTHQCQPGGDAVPVAWDPSGPEELAGRLRTAMALLPPMLGGAPSQSLDVGRASRVITPAQRSALAVRDGGCVPRLRPAPGLV